MIRDRTSKVKYYRAGSLPIANVRQNPPNSCFLHILYYVYHGSMAGYSIHNKRLRVDIFLGIDRFCWLFVFGNRGFCCLDSHLTLVGSFLVREVSPGPRPLPLSLSPSHNRIDPHKERTLARQPSPVSPADAMS